MAKSSSSFKRDILTTMFILVLLRGCDSMTTLDPGFKITGTTVGDNLGAEVRTAGDINNDGYEDIIIGAPSLNDDQGAVYVIYGGPTSSLLDINLSVTPLDPATTGFMIAGSAHWDLLCTVSTAGDINRDGYDDIIVGAPGKSGDRGAAYVIYGGPTSSFSNIDLALTTLDPLTTGFMITGNVDGLGTSVSTAGDVNNDGYDDIIVGAVGNDSYSGAAYVIYGAPKSSSSNIDLSSTTLDPATTGFTISGNAIGDDVFGNSVRAAGDIDHDGYGDIIVGATGNNNYRGAAYVIYGGPKSSLSNIDLKTTTLDPATTGFKISGDAVLDFLGVSVSTAGDINNDGYDDIIVGASLKAKDKGAAYVIYGGPKSSLSNIDLKATTLDPATTGFMVSGSATGDTFGVSVSTAGDINNDGYDDIIVGAPLKSSFVGAAYVIYGGPKSSMSNIDLKTMTLDPATTGFMIPGITIHDGFGQSVSTAGDVNNDGFKDIIIGAPSDFTKGTAFVIYGGPKPSMTNLAF